jgi:phospholipid/cholesterol/gamma-HCH transport system substrate-binding protein
LPSQKQLKWSQLKVGITVLSASITLGVLIFLMSGTGGFLTPKIKLKSYFDNAGGLRVGAPVRLNGVDIGNVSAIQIVPDRDKLLPKRVKSKTGRFCPAAAFPIFRTSCAPARVLYRTWIR